MQVLEAACAQLISEVNGWAERLYKSLLAGDDLHRFLETGSDLIHMPIVMFDAGFHVIGYHIGENPKTHDFEMVLGLGYAPPEYMAQERMRNMERKVLESDSAIVGHGIEDVSTYNIYRGHKIDGRFAALTMIFCGYQQPQPYFMELCEMFFEAADIYIRLHEKNTRPLNFLYENLLVSLMQAEQYPEAELAAQLKYIHFSGEGIFTLVTFDFGAGDQAYTYLCGLLQKYFPDLYFFVYKEKVRLLYRAEKKSGVYHHKATLSDVLNTVRSRLGEGYPAVYYISNPFEHIKELYYAGRQCDLLAAAAERAKAGSKIFFGEHLQETALSCLKQILPEKYLIPPVLKEIERYDRGNGTQLLETLRAYLKYGGNLSAAAEALQLHRNSVDKRIKKTELLFRLDLKDTKTLAALYGALL